MSTADHLDRLPKGAVIQVSTPYGKRFWLEAEGGVFRDFVLRRGEVPRGLRGSASRFGQPRLFWPSSLLERWVAEGRCTIELAPPTTRAGRS